MDKIEKILQEESYDREDMIQVMNETGSTVFNYVSEWKEDCHE